MEVSEERELAAWRAAQVDDIKERAGQPVSRARMLQIRAHAIALGRDKLMLTGAARAASLQNERAVLAASERAYLGENVELAFSAERVERTGAAGLSSVATIPISDATSVTTPTLTAYASRFNTWAEILNPREGHFKETVATSAFTRSLASDEKILALYMHGRDPLMAQRPLGLLTLSCDAHGLLYSVETIPHRSVEYLVEACRMGLMDSSFSFEPRDDSWRQPTHPTATNPGCLPERTLIDVRLREVGPCPLAAYSGTTVSVRAGGDEVDRPKRRTGAERRAVLRDIQLHDVSARRR